jgi:hypothetical protein
MQNVNNVWLRCGGVALMMLVAGVGAAYASDDLASDIVVKNGGPTACQREASRYEAIKPVR